MNRLNGVFILDRDAMDLIYGAEDRDHLAVLVNFIAPPLTKEAVAADPTILKDVDVIFSGWGCPVMDETLLSHAPRLKAVFYGAGAIGHWATDAFWKRQITVTCAAEANAIPVAEYSLATILFSLKHGWSLAQRTRDERTFPDRNQAPGGYGSTVGLISLGAVARKLIEKLQMFDLNLIAYDPFITAAEAELLGVERVSLDQMFRTADVVSLHTPLLDETVGMIRGSHFASMKHGATFINTARGEIVREEEMIEVLAARPDLHAVLDVTATEPPVTTSPLYTMPNITITPHIAGSVGAECRRMGRYMVEEFDRYLRGEALKWQVRPSELIHTVHRPVAKVQATVFTTPAKPAKVAL